jgi:hypothetical protein
MAAQDAFLSGTRLVHEMAPWAYDPNTDQTKTSLGVRQSVTIQTHNAVSVALSSNNLGATQTSNGYDQLAVGVKVDVSTTRSVEVWWYADSGATNLIGQEVVVAVSNANNGTGRTSVKGPYFKVNAVNGDAGSAHTFSTWAHLIP